MENQKPFPFGNDIFANAFEEFDESTFFKRLEERVKPQSYYHKNKGLKNTVLALSYLFNLFSMITASYLIFSLVKWLTGITLLAYLLVGIFLFFLEKLKRKSSNEFFQVWFFSKKLAVGWLTLSLALFAGSVASTYLGTDKATRDFAPTAPIVIQDSTISSLQQELVFLQQENERLKQWKNDEGKVYWTAQKSVQLNTERMNNIQQLLSQKENRKDIKNEQIEASHTEEVIVTASTLSWITVLMEILFECCIAYIWYFYYRSFVERKIVGRLEIDHSPAPSVSQLPPPESNITATLQELQQQIKKLQEQQQSGISDLRPPQESQKNGVHGEINDIRRPIGFTKNQKMPYNALQCVATNEKTFLKDRYTITHKDSRTGEIKHYTLARVENFITHYQKAVQIAIRTKMEAPILDNRKRWLSYWTEKKMELLAKQKEVLS